MKKTKYGETESGRAYMPHPTYQEYTDGLYDWQRQFPARLKVSVCGKTLAGNDILLCEVTDFTIPHDEKQIFFYYCTHVGVEINGMTTGLHFVKWLLGDSELAAETRRKQRVLSVLIAMPDAYIEHRYSDPEKGEGNPTAGYYSWRGVLKPEKNPEAVALVDILEKYQPDVCIDAHGFAQADASMCESTGVSGGQALVSRTWMPKIIDLMIEAADSEGFGVGATNGERGGGMMETTGEILVQYRAGDIGAEYNEFFAHKLCAHHFCFRETNITLAVYAYHLYHTFATIMEIGIEQSALAQLKKLMEIGNSRWPTEYCSGYPVNFMGYGQSVALAGYGATASARRDSRVEIWRKFNQFSMGYGNPPNRGDMTVLVSTNSRGAQYLFPDNADARQKYESARNSNLQMNAIYDSFDNLFKRLENIPQFNLAAIKSFQSKSPVDRYHSMYTPFGFPDDEEPMRHGIGIRLFIPFADIATRNVLLDGHPLDESETYGYHYWKGSGTIVQVNLPPERIRALHIIQCDYDMKKRYPCGFSEDDWNFNRK